MKLVALNEYTVVAFEENGSINLDVEHTRVVQVPDEEPVGLGWLYQEPNLQAKLTWKLFLDPNDKPEQIMEPIVYAVDENGKQYVVENPT